MPDIQTQVFFTLLTEPSPNKHSCYMSSVRDSMNRNCPCPNEPTPMAETGNCSPKFTVSWTTFPSFLCSYIPSLEMMTATLWVWPIGTSLPCQVFVWWDYQYDLGSHMCKQWGCFLWWEAHGFGCSTIENQTKLCSRIFAFRHLCFAQLTIVSKILPCECPPSWDNCFLTKRIEGKVLLLFKLLFGNSKKWVALNGTHCSAGLNGPWKHKQHCPLAG